MTSRNRLVDETSPYLLQHKDNPVHWYPWGEEALTEAKRQDKPILLSVGYAACHWCHVMAHESFEDEAIAEEMNTRFINIKIDREERPDLDAIYQGALAATGQPGGWPLTMFLTPEGHPFWGGTYFPPVSNYGRPSFPDVLQGISDTYKNDKKKVLENVTGINEALIRMIAPTPSSPRALGIDDIDRAAATALGYVDTIHGGTHGAPKFPQTDFFESLWRAYRRSGDVQYKRAVIHTATLICQGGIYDHLAGGFARYSTDHQWLVPHFEKMLYDNALLISLLTTLWRHSRNPLFAQRIEETISWCLRDLHYKNQDGSGGFFSSFDADSEGVEGKFYVWSEAEIDQLLGPDSSDFKRAYNVSAEGNWEGANILHRPATAEPGSADWESRMAICRQVLLKARAARVPPARDDKILADWNGLMITALAEAGAALNRSEWINAAKETFTFVTRHMTAEGNRLLHSWCGGSANHPAVLEDYANLAQGALSLYEITGSQHYLDQAVKWVEIVQTYYADEDGGGYFMAASDTANLIARSKPYADNAVPAGNGTLMQVLAKLHHLTGDDHFRKMTSHVIKGIMAESEAHLTHQATVLMGLETLINPISIVVIGDPDDPETTALVSEILRRDIPTRVLSLLPRDRELPPGHPAHGKSRVDGKPTTYICPGQTCGLPITDKETLKEALTSL